MRLWADFLDETLGRERQKWIHYFEAYEQHFSRFVGRDVLFLEIGCGFGGSLQLWKRYLGPRSQILGIDIRPDCVEFEDNQTSVRIGSQSDLNFLQSVVEEFGVPDVILDDGSHQMSDVNATFSYLYPLQKPNSVYMVEDLHTAYDKSYGGGLGLSSTFIEKSKCLIDELNGYFVEGKQTDFTRSTRSMHFYDSVVVFEKGRHNEPVHFAIGGVKAQ